ncbi:hypothetical protein [Sporosarcina sp. ZBG7A]|uniref:hypothetical protein n=1 Tax=Sporosarcina sp. ZBG7A TaxID=1582223 RepID=UPI000A40ED49|nr:hypothetical protein [Sporosarcina sp. ZBG7A]
MLKHFTSVIGYIFSRIEIINPTNVARDEILKEMGRELREEFTEIKRLKKP